MCKYITVKKILSKVAAGVDYMYVAEILIDSYIEYDHAFIHSRIDQMAIIQPSVHREKMWYSNSRGKVML